MDYCTDDNNGEEDSSEAGVCFYMEYGSICGFDIRRSTTRRFRDEVIRVQYVLCNREGFKNSKIPNLTTLNDDDTNNTNTTRRREFPIGLDATHVAFLSTRIAMLTNYSEPADFERKWTDVMTYFNLTSHPWFITMFEIRSNWIPAYFRDVPMGALLRTTSRSESTNSWFGGYTNPQATLVEFIMHFDSAMDSQRHASDKLNSDSESFHPTCTTPLDIEKHASYVYTHTLFSDVIKEVQEACYKCTVVQISQNAQGCSYTIRDSTTKLFIVNCYNDNSVMKCNCKMFEGQGLICRHMFVLLKDQKEIPSKFLMKRWMKTTSLRPSNARLYQFAGGDASGATLNNLWSDFHSCIGLAQGDVEKLANLSRLLAEEKERMTKEQSPFYFVPSKEVVIQNFCGSTSQIEVSVLPPSKQRIKVAVSCKESHTEPKGEGYQGKHQDEKEVWYMWRTRPT
ncbi:hypothetical protein DH2020_004143 [Rehmannia glutinosa]|uniref:SWIM-type domain-containing protein n=1 Tax=Rehmannia glutinosa TaxID=99300 RepID=A0ABR0XNQ8_REHGL